MKYLIRVAFALLVASASSGAFAQAERSAVIPPESVAPASMVGKWVHNAQGQIIGGVRAVSSNGRTVEIMVGDYFQPGSHAKTVPASALSIASGNVTLQTGTVEALNQVTPK